MTDAVMIGAPLTITEAEVTNSPTAVGRSLTNPEKGALITVSVIACWAVPTCVRAASTPA